MSVNIETRCKICGREVYHNYCIKGSEHTDIDSRWFHCSCGCVFNFYSPKETPFNDKYRQGFLDFKERGIRYDWYIRNYITIVEENTYGRKFLDVGSTTDDIVDNLRKRGWVGTGIDLINPSFIKDDFMSYSFPDKFDLIWMNDVLQCFTDPMEALRKAYNLLNDTGFIFIGTPNTDLIRTGKIAEWGHWDIASNRQFFSRGLLHKMIERVNGDVDGGLRVILDLDTHSIRFTNKNCMHLLLQKAGI